MKTEKRKTPTSLLLTGHAKKNRNLLSLLHLRENTKIVKKNWQKTRNKQDWSNRDGAPTSYLPILPTTLMLFSFDLLEFKGTMKISSRKLLSRKFCSQTNTKRNFCEKLLNKRCAKSFSLANPLHKENVGQISTPCGR